jgi:16S rRNA (cytosine1402-N4)-methyltransferase|tara:strand:- start:33492 stop:34409 length:918 start_codon:yes stop_codon:yes gene_type:complete
MESDYHFTVMKNEAIKNLNLKRNGTYLDATLGMGGHTDQISKTRNDIKKIICLDNDINSIKLAKIRLAKFDDKIEFICGNFKDIDKLINEKVDGVILDLGISTYQLLNADRGFSFKSGNKLDMRISLEQELTAHEIVNTFSVDKISEILKNYGEEKNHFKIASEIARQRTRCEISTADELNKIIKKINKNSSKINSSTRTFQALRIAVNNELDAIEKFLEKSEYILNKGARLVVITFHSLEDRIVKKFFKLSESKCLCPESRMMCDCKKKQTLKIITKKPIRPSVEEVLENPSSRSAKMRIGEAI